MIKEVKTSRGTLEKEWFPITVDNVGPNPWNDKADRAQLRQIIVTRYPGATVNSEHVDNLFELSEYGIDSEQEHESVRVCWADVPKGMTVQQVENQLKRYPNATIYRIIGDDISDVLTKGQLYAADGKVTEILDETGLQYRATGFKLEYHEDVDKRAEVERLKADAGMAEAREQVNADPAETLSSK